MASLFATRSDLFAVGRRAVATTPNIRLNPSVADIPGSDLNIAIGIDSVIGEEVSMRGAAAMRGAFAELARDAQLDRVIYDRSGLLRFSATPATVDLVLARPTPGSATPGTYSSGSVVQTADGTQFGLNTDAVFGDFATSVGVSATATTVGAVTNVAAGTITGFSTAPFDTTLTVTNPASAAGGMDTEDPISFLGRYRAFFPTLSKGTLGAIEFGALQVPGVAVATATEILNPNDGFPAAIVQLVIGDKNGNATSDMIRAVSDKLLGYRAGGMPVIVIGGVVIYQPVQWALAFQFGVDEKLATQRVRAITVAVGQFLAPGGTLYRSKLISAASQVPGVIIKDSALLLPLGDVEPTAGNQMIRILPEGVTFA
jgi:uncharacterized phage protein gp47/JayE